MTCELNPTIKCNGCGECMEKEIARCEKEREEAYENGVSFGGPDMYLTNY